LALRLASVALAVLTAVAALTGCEYEGDSGPRVAMVGDSIMRAADAPMTRQMTVDYRFLRWNQNGARIDEQLEMIRPYVGVVADPRVLVIALGTNDAAQGRTVDQVRTAVNELLAAVLPEVRRCVIWFNLKTTDIGPGTPPIYNDRAPRINALLAEVDAAQPKVRVFDYAAWAASRPDLFFPDGIHPTAAGARALAAETVRQVGYGCAVPPA